MRKTKFWLVLSLIATSLSIFACKKDSTTTKTSIPEVSKAKASTKLFNATAVATTDYELIWSDEFNSNGDLIPQNGLMQTGALSHGISI